MEIVKLCKSTYNNQLQQSTYLCHKRNMSQIWQVNILLQSPAKVKGHTIKHTQTPQRICPYQVSTFYTLWNPKNSPDKILKLMVTMTRSSYNLRFLRYSPDKLFAPTRPKARLPAGMPARPSAHYG